jgi:hypothetical protein
MSDHSCPGAATDLRLCTEFEYILLGDLRDLLEDSPSDENRKWLLAVLDALVDTLPKEFALKSRNGYLSDVLLEFPNWDREVDRLEEQHVRLYKRLRQLRDRVVTGRALDLIAERLRGDLQNWMESFTTLHHQERELVMEAVNLEVGTGD